MCVCFIHLRQADTRLLIYHCDRFIDFAWSFVICVLFVSEERILFINLQSYTFHIAPIGLFVVACTFVSSIEIIIATKHLMSRSLPISFLFDDAIDLKCAIHFQLNWKQINPFLWCSFQFLFCFPFIERQCESMLIFFHFLISVAIK